MSFEPWKNRFGWLAMVVAILVSGRLAQAQSDTNVDDEDVLIINSKGRDVLKARPWLGLHCFPADAALRAQVKLPEGAGLVVGGIAPDSPAAKGGIETNDILLKAGDQALKEVSDLVKALEASDEKPLKFEILRAGEPKTLEVTPGHRKAEIVIDEKEDEPDRDIVRSWVKKFRDVPQIVIDELPERIKLFKAGVPFSAPFPKDLNLTVTKEGDAPAKIVVKKGDEQWETTEDKLGELPESVRGYVEMFLGKFPTALPPGVPFNISVPPPGGPGPKSGAPDAGGPDSARFAPKAREAEIRVRKQVAEAKRHAEDAARRLRDQGGQRIEQRIERLEQQLQERLEKLDRLIEERAKAIEGTPSTPAVPAQPAKPARPAEPAGPTLPEPEET